MIEKRVKEIEISLDTLKEIVNNMPPLQKEVGLPLPDKELLSKEYYDQLYSNYIEYMSNLHVSN